MRLEADTWNSNVQCATWGYPTESAYYRDASSVDAALNIKIPVLALHSKDDPICSDLAIPYHEFTVTPYIVMCATSIGGHLGWFKSDGERWSNQVVSSFGRLPCRTECAADPEQIHGFFDKFAKDTDVIHAAKIELDKSADPNDGRPHPIFHAALRRLEVPT